MIYLQRVTLGAHGTFGQIVYNDLPLCLTLEDPWNDNKRNASCIPPGEYYCEPYNGAKYRNVWILNGVPGRSAILIHAGNTADDTQGCILPGLALGYIGQKRAVLNSKPALQILRETLPRDFTIRISNPC